MTSIPLSCVDLMQESAFPALSFSPIFLFETMPVKLEKTKSLESWIGDAPCSICGAKDVPRRLLIEIPDQGETIGNSSITRVLTSINQHFASVQFHAAKLVPDFVLWFMQARYDYLLSVAYGVGSTTVALSCGFLKTLPVAWRTGRYRHHVLNTQRQEGLCRPKHSYLRDLFRTPLHELMTAKNSIYGVELSMAN